MEYNLLVLEALLKEYENSRILEIRRGRLLSLCQDKYDEKYHGISELGHSSFRRCLIELEDEMAIKIAKKGKKYTMIIVNIQKIKKMINDIKAQQGLYRQDVKFTQEEMESKEWEHFFQQLTSAMIDNYNRPWIHHIDEQSQDAHLIAQRCASRIAAILISSRFGFSGSLTKDSSFKSIEKNHLYELVIITSKIASKNLEEPFQLLIDYSGLPRSVEDWGIMSKGDLLRQITVHFELFAERVFKFEFTSDDLYNLRKGYLDKLSKEGGRLFDIFYNNYLLPTLETIGSKNIKFDSDVSST